MRLEPRSYFWICWKVSPTASPNLVWFMASSVRLCRTRVPTWTSTEWKLPKATPFQTIGRGITYRRSPPQGDDHGQAATPIGSPTPGSLDERCQVSLRETAASSLERHTVCTSFSRRFADPWKRSPVSTSSISMMRPPPTQWPDRVNAVSTIANEPVLNSLRHSMPPSLDISWTGRLRLIRSGCGGGDLYRTEFAAQVRVVAIR